MIGITLDRLGDALDDAVTELLALYPQLASALERDSGASEGERVTTSTNVHVLPVNLDVLAAVKMLHEQAWAAAHEARVHLAEPGDMVSLTGTIASTAILYRRLVGQGKPAQARHLAGQVFRWHRTVRAAIGLTLRDRPLRGTDGPVCCPLHDDPLTQLQQVGDEGHIDAEAAGDREAITWQRGGGLYCRHCGGGWGPGEYAFLGRLVGEQRLRIDRQATA